MDLGIKGKTALITGAGNGIGAVISARLAAEGAQVVICDVNAEAAQAQADRLRASGAKAMAYAANVTVQAEVEAMVAAAVAEFGSVDILVNNAGLTRDMSIGRMTEGDWDLVVDVIMKGTFLCTKAAAPAMRAAGWGRVINISSRAHLGNPGQANYSAAKAGVIGFTRAMSLELGRYGITVNAVAPGMIRTAMVEALPHWEKIRESAINTTPVQRIGEPEDVADAVAFLASNLAGYISGDVLHVSGGRY